MGWEVVFGDALILIFHVLGFLTDVEGPGHVYIQT